MSNLKKLFMRYLKVDGKVLLVIHSKVLQVLNTERTVAAHTIQSKHLPLPTFFSRAKINILKEIITMQGSLFLLI